MFTRQAPIISDSLLQGGLAAPQAYAVTNALGQCRAPLVHRAPIEIDYSSPEMRLILPEQVPVKFPDIIIKPPEIPPQRPPELPPPEEVPPQEPNPLPPQNPVGPIQPPMGAPGGPSYPGGGGGGTSGLPPWLFQWMKEAMEYYKKLREDFDNLVFEAGDYIDLDEANDTKRYKLKTENDKDGYVCTFGPDEIVGKEFDEMMFDYALLNNDSMRVVTDVTLDATGLVIHYGRAAVWHDEGPDGQSTIPVVDCP